MNHNMCGSDKLQVKLREEGGIRALLGMVRSRHPDVLAQVARGIANFAKCESRGAAQGRFPMITLVSYACAESIEEGMHL
jgi:kinesin family protein 5